GVVGGGAGSRRGGVAGGGEVVLAPRRPKVRLLALGEAQRPLAVGLCAAPFVPFVAEQLGPAEQPVAPLQIRFAQPPEQFAAERRVRLAFGRIAGRVSLPQPGELGVEAGLRHPNNLIVRQVPVSGGRPFHPETRVSPGGNRGVAVRLCGRLAEQFPAVDRFDFGLAVADLGRRAVEAVGRSPEGKAAPRSPRREGRRYLRRPRPAPPPGRLAARGESTQSPLPPGGPG